MLWIVMTIVEPFPLWFSHVAWPTEQRRETARGPFYAANSKRYFAPEHRAHAESSAAYLRERGWTVILADEERY